MRTMLFLLSAGFMTTMVLAVAEEQSTTSEISILRRPPIRSLSPQALEALVTGVASYPDDFIAQILDAAQEPDLLHAAAQKQPGEYPPSIGYLLNYPEAVQRLDQHLAFTTRLGLAAKHQSWDIWPAIARVRGQFTTAIQTTTGATSPSTPNEPPTTKTASTYRQLVTALVADDVAKELESTHARATSSAGIPATAEKKITPSASEPPREKPPAPASERTDEPAAITARQYSDQELKSATEALSESWGELEKHVSAARHRTGSQRTDGQPVGSNHPGSTSVPGFQPYGGSRQPSYRPGPIFGGRRR